LQPKSFNGERVFIPPGVPERRAWIVRVSSDTDGMGSEGAEPPAEGKEEGVSVENLPLESKLQLKLEQKLRMKLAKKIRLRRKRLVRKRRMRKKKKKKVMKSVQKWRKTQEKKNQANRITTLSLKHSLPKESRWKELKRKRG